MRLKTCLPEWLADDEADHRRLEADVRLSLLSASRATLDRLLVPARLEHRRRVATRPGSLWRGEIPLRTEWPEAAPGHLEQDTVALCGGSLDDRHGWRFDAVDIPTTWGVLRGLLRGEFDTSGDAVRHGHTAGKRTCAAATQGFVWFIGQPRDRIGGHGSRRRGPRSDCSRSCSSKWAAIVASPLTPR